MRVGVIGAGLIGRGHMRRFAAVVPGAQVVAVTDIDPERAAGAAADSGAVVYGSGAELIAASEVDAVVVTTPGFAHAESVLAAIAEGKQVFCEKPLATAAADALRIIEAEAAVGRRLVQVGFMRRFDAGYQQLRRLVTDGSIGAPLLMHCVHRNQSVPQEYTTAMAASDTAVHEIDVVRWLLAEEIVSVQVLRPRPTSNRSPELADPQIFLFETACGARVDVETFVNCSYGYDIQCEIVGQLGAARLPDPATAQIRRDGQATVAVPPGWSERFNDAFEVELRAWHAGASAGAPSGPSAWDGYAAAVVVDACVAAQQSGAVVPVTLPDRPALYT